MANDFQRFVGTKIAALRRSYGLSQAKFAEEIGLSRSNIQRVEQGHYFLRIPSLVAICRRFNVPADELLGLRTPTTTSMLPERIDCQRLVAEVPDAALLALRGVLAHMVYGDK